MNPEHIQEPSIINAAGTPPKKIEEFFGAVTTGQSNVSIARMISPSGWKEPGQTPEFDEYCVVLSGELHLDYKKNEELTHMTVTAGQAVHSKAGMWVQYSTPSLEGAVYMAICIPAFSPISVHRDFV